MDTEKKVNGFVGGLGFILAAAGSAVGLGNLWSFPYKTSQHGGAAFVFVYIISVIVMGFIVMIAEIYLGKRAQANPVSSYKKINNNLGWIGLLSIFVPFLVTCYYAVLGGYTVKFTLNSFSDNTSVMQSFSGNVGEVILYTAIFMILVMVVIMAGVQKGIEKSSKILMPILFVILVGIVMCSLFLGNGVLEGLNYYLNPDFSALGFDGVLAAMGQAFFSLSLGMGVMISYGSYTGKNIKVGKSAMMIAIFDTLVAFLAGLAIFPAIYHYYAETGIELTNSGVVLMFSSLPIVFKSLGIAGNIVSFFFFGMVSIAAITSAISMLEVATQFIIQKFSIKRKKAIAIVGSIGYLVSVPVGISLGFALTGKEGMTIAGQDWLTFFDLIGNTVLMPVCAFGACIALGWFTFKGKNAKENLSSNYLCSQLEEDGLKLGKFGKVFSFMVKYITPILIAVVEIFGIIDIVFPTQNGAREFSGNGLVVVVTAYAIMLVFIVLYFLFLKKKETGSNEDEITKNLS
ncbi:MAG: sodium-dependent transporter [Clostridiales bacterium]|nr:sodium-dependent transporter [Clostridiales bacterium]